MTDLSIPKPDSPESDWVLHCANISQTFGAGEALLAAFQNGLLHYPQSSRLLFNMGVTLVRLKKESAAQKAWQQLLSFDAKHLKAHRGLAELALKKGEASLAGQHAEQAFDISLKAHPPHGDLVDWMLVGECLLACGEWDEALAWLEQARHVAEVTSANDALCQQVDIIYHRSQLLTSRGQGDLNLEDLIYLQQALSIRHKACDWREFDTWHHVMHRLIELAKNDHKLALPRGLAWDAMHMRLSHAELQLFARAACQHIRQIEQPHDMWQPTDGFHSHHKLRIAYVSHDFRDHPCSQLAHQMFRDHNRSRFEVTAYALNEDDGSDMRHHIQHSVDHFVDMSEATPRAVAERIRQDEIDVLIGMGGHTEGLVVDVCMWRPAPVQINFMSFNGTVGAGDTFDAHLSDAVSSPPEFGAWFDETLHLLPGGFFCYNDERTILPLPSRTSLGLPEQGLVLSGFNNSYKIEPETFDAWCAIMRQLPDSVLWLYTVHGEQKYFLNAAAQARNIDANRLFFSEKVGPDEHLARLACIDLHLDTFIYNGHTTMLDVLFAGTPAVTRCGTTLVGRIGSSFLMELGLDDCVTYDTDTYIARAVELAGDPKRRQAIREHLMACRQTKLPFDSKQRARQFDQAYQQLWEQKRTRLGASPAKA